MLKCKRSRLKIDSARFVFIVNTFKANFGKPTEESSEGNIGGVEYELDYIFKPNTEEVGPLPFIIDGEADNDTLQIKIKYKNDTYSVKSHLQEDCGIQLHPLFYTQHTLQPL